MSAKEDLAALSVTYFTTRRPMLPTVLIHTTALAIAYAMGNGDVILMYII